MFCLALENAYFRILGKFRFELSSIKLAISEEIEVLSVEEIK